MPVKPELCVVFAEEDTLFRLMEAALLRRSTPQADKALAYFFGPDISSPLATLTTMADRLGLPPAMEARVCVTASALEEALPLADFVVVEREPFARARIQACTLRTRLIQKFGRDCSNIDLAAAGEHGIKVANLIRFSSLSSSDNIMALLLALARNLLKAHNSVLARRDTAALPRFEAGPPRTKFNWSFISDIRVLASQTLGLVGLGENSREVARRARSFGMRVVYYKPSRISVEEQAELGCVQFLPLDALLAEADFVSLHVPYEPATEKMVDAAFLEKMKWGSFLINTARGGVVDEQALYQALQRRRLAGAALDVYRYEPVPPDCPLLELESVLWTPHMSGGEPGFMLREVEDVLSNMARILRGELPAGLVN